MHIPPQALFSIQHSIAGWNLRSRLECYSNVVKFWSEWFILKLLELTITMYMYSCVHVLCIFILMDVCFMQNSVHCWLKPKSKQSWNRRGKRRRRGVLTSDHGTEAKVPWSMHKYYACTCTCTCTLYIVAWIKTKIYFYACTCRWMYMYMYQWCSQEFHIGGTRWCVVTIPWLLVARRGWVWEGDVPLSMQSAESLVIIEFNAQIPLNFYSIAVRVCSYVVKVIHVALCS